MQSEDRLDPDRIRANLKTRRIGTNVLVYERTSSTNDVASEYARNPVNDGLVVFAEEQTCGRGRSGARWHSDYGQSLLFSALLIDRAVVGEMLPLTCAVAVAEALGQVGGEPARIKWPNDIVLADRKVGGILLESKPSAVSRTHIIGIGINCHQTEEDFPSDLRETATSLDLVSGVRCHRVTLARKLVTSLDHWLDVAERDGARVIETWDRRSTLLHQRITVSYNGKHFAGNCIGVDPQKGLILQLDRGGVRMFDAAHTRIVK